MSNMITCPRNHIFDADKYVVCPYCGTMDVGRVSTAGAARQSKGGTQDWTPQEHHGGTSRSPQDQSKAGSRTIYAGMHDGRRPVYGWLVVVEGRGKGASFEVYAGLNRIGRDRGEVMLNFGDMGIGGDEHARLLIDERTLTFAIQHASGKNLTYLNDEALFATHRALKAYDRVRLSETTLVFVPLCGERFDWGAT